jgi:hypothetical protein
MPTPFMSKFSFSLELKSLIVGRAIERHSPVWWSWGLAVVFVEKTKIFCYLFGSRFALKRMQFMKVCSVEGCGKKHDARGLCAAHYVRFKKSGVIGGPLRTPNGEPARYLEEVVLNHASDACLTWPYAIGIGGYGRMVLNGKRVTVSRLVCERIHGAPPSNDYHAAHSCGKGHLACVSPTHLSWKTRQENMADMEKHGTRLKGSRLKHARLTEDDIRAIRAEYEGHRRKEIASHYGVTPSTISKIIERSRWAHVV